MKHFFNVLLWLGFSLSRLYAQIYHNDTYGYQLEPPIGWHRPITLEDNHTAFQDAEKSLTMGVVVLNESSLNEEAIIANLLKILPVNNYEYELFDYYDHTALVGYFNFTHQNQDLVGPFVVLYYEEVSYWLYGFYPDALEDRYFIFTQSMIDSFNLSSLGQYRQGLLSVYNDQLWQSQARYEELTLQILNQLYTVQYNPQDEMLSQAFIEREAQILLSYSPKSPDALLAWQRYYRMIFKDTYPRLQAIGELWKNVLKDKSKAEIAQTLLAFSQDFNYMRTPYLLSGLISPLSGGLHRIGDCDSMGLLYSILLAYMDISSVMLISQQQAHAIIGVDTLTSKEAIPTILHQLDGRSAEYIFAELTVLLPLGTIPAELYQVKDWLVIPF